MRQSKKMRIGIFGSYNYTSIGDHAILEGILTQFRRHSDDLAVVIFSFAPSSTENMLASPTGVTVTEASPCLTTSITPQEMESQRISKMQNLRQKVRATLKRRLRAKAGVARVYRWYLLQKKDLNVLRHVIFWYHKLNEIKKLDILIIGGGNLIMDLYSSWPVYPLIYVILAKLARVPVMFYAVGVGPIRSRRARWYFKLACHLADRITLRDKESLALLNGKLKIKTDKLCLAADPALCLERQGSKIRKGSPSSLIVGMTVVPFYSPKYWPDPNLDLYGKYIDYMVNVVNSIIGQFHSKVIFFATNHPNDLVTAHDIVHKISYQKQIELVENRLSVPEIISLIASCDVMIGTRLHSLILSLVAGTPFLAFSYQPKVKAFCKRIGLDRYVIPLSDQLDISKCRILSLLQELVEGEETILAHAQEELKQLRQAAELGCKIAVNLAKRGT
jgi:polysaccharide pyruvyl transferase WcaK-like protein